MPKKRKLDLGPRVENSSQSAHNDLAIGSTTHQAEQARVVIQGELDGNERMDRERQSILRSALQFVDNMAQGKTTNLDKSSPLEVPLASSEEVLSSIDPSPELLYMLLPGTEVSICVEDIVLTLIQSLQPASDVRAAYNGRITSQIKRWKRWLRRF